MKKQVIQTDKNLRDYLSAKERNDFLTMKYMSIMADRLLEDWLKKSNITKAEARLIRLARTWTNKFVEKVRERLSIKENAYTEKRLAKFDVRFIDDYTYKTIARDLGNKLENCVLPREMFGKFSEEIMDINCRHCKQCHTKCDLYDVLDENFIQESGERLPNCRYAYTNKRPRFSPEQIAHYTINPKMSIEKVDEFIDMLDAASMRAMLKDSAREWNKMNQEQK
jgi:hypothetical protein